MSNEKLKLVRAVTVKTHRVEQSIDNAIADTADWIKAMVIGRQEAKMAATVGHDAIAKAGQAMQVLITAREKMVESHNLLAETRDAMNIPVTDSGDVWKLPPPGGSLREDKDKGDNVIPIAS